MAPEIIFLILIITAAVIFIIYYKKRLFLKPKDLGDDVILVTGAANGIGRLLCIELAKYCGKIVGWDIDEKGLEETALRVFNETGVRLICQRCDLSVSDEIYSAAAELQKNVGTITLLINNAGVVSGKFLLELKNMDLERTLAVNFFAPFHTTRAFLPGMIGNAYDDVRKKIPSALRQKDVEVLHHKKNSNRAPHGHIVFLTSIASTVPAPGLSDYCASKAASSMMSSCLEMEIRKLNLNNNIKITEIRPFVIDTEMFSGCKFRFQSLFPILNGEKVARRIVDAILFNEFIVNIPGRISLLPILHHILPKWILRFGNNLAGATTLMDSFDESRKIKVH